MGEFPKNTNAKNVVETASDEVACGIEGDGMRTLV
jgi:hypothetical protein